MERKTMVWIGVFLFLAVGLGWLRVNKGRLLGVRDSRTRVILGGDVMLGRSVMTKSRAVGDRRYPFLQIGGFLRAADLVFVNLENPIVEDCPARTNGMVFCADPEMIEGLEYAGVDVVNLANNHSRNYGQKGLEETVRHLREAEVETTGLGGVVKREVDGVVYGFVGFDWVSRQPVEADWELVRRAAGEADVLIVGVHWGSEYQAVANKYQREWASRLVDLGADVVVGHHPHWVQDEEKINGARIYYSLGNLVFDQMWSEETRRGELIELVFDGGRVVEEKRRQTYIREWGQPELVQ